MCENEHARVEEGKKKSVRAYHSEPSVVDRVVYWLALVCSVFLSPLVVKEILYLAKHIRQREGEGTVQCGKSSFSSFCFSTKAFNRWKR